MGKKIRWIPGIVGLCLVLGASGCAKSAGAGSSYALDQRIGTFAASGSGRTADGFAADLAVVTDETSVDETLTAESAGVFPLEPAGVTVAIDATALIISCTALGFFSHRIAAKKPRMVYLLFCGAFVTILTWVLISNTLVPIQ